jgi:pimeloyl-ACP methyl ester carboxylesterase
VTAGAADPVAGHQGPGPGADDRRRGGRGSRNPWAHVDLAATFDTIGPAGAAAIVFLHGTRLTRSMWRPQRPLASTYQLVMADLPGHGSLSGVPFTLASASRHVGRIIDAGGGRAVVVGQSLGGYVAMDLAARRPDQVGGLVLCNCTQEPWTIALTAPVVVGGYLARAALMSRGHGPARGDALGAAEAFGVAEAPGAASGGIGTAPGPLADVARGHGPATEGWLFKGGTRALFAALGMTFVPRLRAFAGPTLIVNGAGDRLFRRGEARFLAAAADGRLLTVEGADHVPSEEAPEVFNAIVRAFMEDLATC